MKLKVGKNLDALRATARGTVDHAIRAKRSEATSLGPNADVHLEKRLQAQAFLATGDRETAPMLAAEADERSQPLDDYARAVLRRAARDLAHEATRQAVQARIDVASTDPEIREAVAEIAPDQARHI